MKKREYTKLCGLHRVSHKLFAGCGGWLFHDPCRSIHVVQGLRVCRRRQLRRLPGEQIGQHVLGVLLLVEAPILLVSVCHVVKHLLDLLRLIRDLAP